MSFASEIRQAYEHLIAASAQIPLEKRTLKIIESTGAKVSVADLIAYQIGWGQCLISWYEAGIKGLVPQMPGDGFDKWDYGAIASHFYKKYHYDGNGQQLNLFNELVMAIIEIVKKEEQANRLDQLEVWSWCTLPSGKHWPLRKWVQVNTIAPYKRATSLIKKAKVS